MKRYWLFAYDAYYPLGGMSDFKGSFDTKDEALMYCAALSDGFYHVFDTQGAKIVATNDSQLQSPE